MNVLACSAHALAVDSALFAAPPLILGLALWIATWRERRRRRTRSAAETARSAA